MLCAAAFGSLSGSSWAFVVAPQAPSVPSLNNGRTKSRPTLPQTRVQLHQRPTTSRLFFSQQQDNDNDWQTFKRAGGNLLKKGVGKIKSLIPFGEETRAEMIKKERKEEITSGLNTMLKDMPLPIRMMGRMVSPLLARAAEEIAEQTAQARDMLDEARIRLADDSGLAEELGGPLRVGEPFSQSSSTMVVNGRSTARVQASFQVVGPRGSGIATMESMNGEITSLNVNANGRNMSIGSRRGGNDFRMASSSKDDNIIEAEIIEKK